MKKLELLILSTILSTLNFNKNFIPSLMAKINSSLRICESHPDIEEKSSSNLSECTPLKFYANLIVYPAALMPVIVVRLINIKRKGRGRERKRTVVQLLSKIRGRSSSRRVIRIHTQWQWHLHLTHSRQGEPDRPAWRSGPFRAVSRCCPRDYLEIKVQNHEQILILRIVIAR